MNLSGIQAALQALGYGTDTVGQQTVFINMAYREICGMMRWPFLEAMDTSLSTVVGTTAYNWPMTNWRNIDAVRLEQPAVGNYTNLEYAAPQDFMDLWHIDRDRATPMKWAMMNSQLWLYPTPDDVWTARINYIIEPQDLSAGTDVPLIPLQYHDVLVWGAVLKMGFRERDWLGRQFAEDEFEKWLKRLEEEYLLRQRQSGSHVRKSHSGVSSLPYPFRASGF